MSEKDRKAGERARVGLCVDCSFAQVVASERGSEFYLCRRAFEEPGYAKYPSLPVLRCAGFVGRGEGLVAYATVLLERA